MQELGAADDDDGQPKRQKLRKRAQLSNESEAENEIAPLDEEGAEKKAHGEANVRQFSFCAFHGQDIDIFLLPFALKRGSDDDEGDLGRAEHPEEDFDEMAARRKKRKRSDSASADGDDNDEDNNAEDPDHDIGSRSRSKRNKRSGKRKKGAAGGVGAGEDDDAPKSKKAAQKAQKEEAEMILATKLKEEAFRFVTLMNEACDADIDANKGNRPALSKIKFLPKVQEVLASLTLQTHLIDCGVLHALRKWLEPLPDKTLPNIRIREALLRGLEHLPVSEGHLQESRIGRIVMFLLKNEAETTANKVLAKKLIDKWSRPVFELSSNWTDLQYHDEVRNLRKLAPTRPVAAPADPGDEELLTSQQEVTIPARKLKVTDFLARMPEKSTMEFTVRPLSAVDPETKGTRVLSATELLERKLRKTKPSGEGRYTSVGITKANRK